MNSLHTEAGALESRYFDRMASSFGDKARMLPWIVGTTVLDVGAGGGDLSEAIAATGRDVIALDMNADAVERLIAHPEIIGVLQGRADEAPELYGRPVDTIVCSAVMHEVYSYGSSTGQQLRPALDETMTALISMLRPGGRLIIRDGVMPERPDAPATLTTTDPAAVDAYLTGSPHPELALRKTGDHQFAGTRHAVAEAMFTITWGPENFWREAWERYQLFTEASYAAYGETFGLRCLHHSTVTQPGYVTALAHITATDADGTVWFPATNGLWVWERPGL